MKAQQMGVLLRPNEVSLQVPKQLLLNKAVRRGENITFILSWDKIHGIVSNILHIKAGNKTRMVRMPKLFMGKSME